MNRYDAKTGRVEHIPEPDFIPKPQPISAFIAASEASDDISGRAEYKKPSGSAGILDGLGGILSKVKKAVPDVEDLVLIAVLYLLYKESGDIEFLLIAGIMLFI
ncbi:MAG: hypothetical protein GX025_03685 [Clostridiales bacterium]|jgi:hypothetical protein|nr:hypothetical protein [Clostridiales bacterium]